MTLTSTRHSLELPRFRRTSLSDPQPNPRRISMPSQTPSNSSPSDGGIPASHNNGLASVNFMKAAIAARAPLVAVTGGLGYLGSHVVARMLAKGYFVRTIVPQGANVNFLLSLTGAKERLQIIPIRDPAAEDARPSLLIAFRGVSTVVHAASFTTHGGKVAKHAASQRIVNALKMSLNAASAPGNVVINFIYLSSDQTVFDPSRYHRKKFVQLTEEDWFDCSKASRESSEPFAFAYTVAEMRLWARVGRGGLPFNVVSVIPSFVIGPVLSDRHVQASPSLSLLYSLASGSLTDVPDIPISPVDVRDVARAITALTERPEIGGRMMLCAESFSASEFVALANENAPEYKWPQLNNRHFYQRASTKGTTETLKQLRHSHFISKDRKGIKYMLSQKRATEELGLAFRSVTDTIDDTLTSLVRLKVLRSPSQGEIDPKEVKK